MIPVVGRRMNLLLLASSSSIAPLPPPSPPLLPHSTVPPMWIHTCSCACCSCSPSSSSRTAVSLEESQSVSSPPFPHRHGIGLESSCRLDSATCSFRGQSSFYFLSQFFSPILFRWLGSAHRCASSFSHCKMNGHRGSF